MNSVVLSTTQKIKGGEKLKKLKNNKGFSLVELLIVIAIMGVLAVIAFNMFGGVLTSSKKKADDQMAQNISKSILTYCIDSNDWEVTKLGGNGADAIAAVLALGVQITVDDKTFGPYINLKYPDADTDAEKKANEAALSPQWNVSAGGDYVGWEIKVYPKLQNVTCKPTMTEGDVKVAVVDGEGAGE